MVTSTRPASVWGSHRAIRRSRSRSERVALRLRRAALPAPATARPATGACQASGR